MPQEVTTIRRLPTTRPNDIYDASGLPGLVPLPLTPSRLPTTSSPYPAPPFRPGGREGLDLYRQMYDIRSQQPHRWSPPDTVLDNAYTMQRGGWGLKRNNTVQGSDRTAINLLDSMYPNAAAPAVRSPDVSEVSGRTIGYFDPDDKSVVVGAGVPRSLGYPVLAHEREHERQSQIGSPNQMYAGDREAAKLALKSSKEIPAMIALILAAQETNRRAMRVPEWRYVGGEKVPFQPAYQPDANWMREMARKHGVFEGNSVTELMAQNPAWVNLIMGKNNGAQVSQ